MKIRKATDSDFKDVFSVEKEAFGYDKEAKLVKDLWLLIRICGLIEAQEAFPCHDKVRV